MKTYLCIGVFAAVFCMAGCGVPKDALQMNPTTLQDRQLQTRVFDTKDESKILSAAAGTIQDLGFTLEESETPLGLIVASKDRDARDAGQIIGAIIVAGLTGAATPVDFKQKIRVSLVTYPAGAKQEKTAVRVTFQRVVWNTQGQVTKLEKLNDQKMYEGFFDKLSKSVFLEAYSI